MPDRRTVSLRDPNVAALITAAGHLDNAYEDLDKAGAGVALNHVEAARAAARAAARTALGDRLAALALDPPPAPSATAKELNGQQPLLDDPEGATT